MHRWHPSSVGWVCLAWGMCAPGCTEYDISKAPDDSLSGEDTGTGPFGEGSSDDEPDEGDPGDGTPDIAVSPGAIDYGLVAVGDAVAEAVSILNEGDGPLTIGQISIPEGAARGYSVTLPEPLPLVLLPGEQVEVLATFTPVDVGAAEGLLRVDSDDPDEPEVPVVLSNDVWLECTDDYSEAMPWKKSELWYGSAFSDQPTDSTGTPWFSPNFDDSGWTVLGDLPDRLGGTSDHDLFYRAVFYLDAVAGTTEIEFEGNDGVWLYVNGQQVGHWGGAWREGGCINDPTGECSVNYEAAPTDVSTYLREGRNVLGVMLTNGPSGYYLDIRATCVE